jgi:hypothetical protein
LHAELMMTQLNKVTNDKSTLHIEYRKVMMDWDEDEQRVARLKNTV